MNEPTFKQFMRRVDATIARVACGMTSEDFCDACWRDLYDDTGGGAGPDEILEFLALADYLFADFLEATRNGGSF